jgi:hypothetical protein
MWSVNKIRSAGGMTMSREKISTQRKPSLIAALSTTNQTWNDLGNKEESFT